MALIASADVSTRPPLQEQLRLFTQTTFSKATGRKFSSPHLHIISSARRLTSSYLQNTTKKKSCFTVNKWNNKKKSLQIKHISELGAQSCPLWDEQLEFLLKLARSI